MAFASAPARGRDTLSRPSQSAISRSSSLQRSCDLGRVLALLEMCGMDQQLRIGAVGLEVDPRHQPVAQQEGQHVVAVRALGDGRVDADAVEEIEDSMGAVALPDQGIERRQQGARLDLARLARGGMEVGRPVPALDLDRYKIAGLDQLGEPRLGVGDAEAEVVAQVEFGGDAQRLRRQTQQLALRFLGAGRRQGDDVGRQHALGEVVDALERAAPRCRGDEAGEEQPFDGELAVVPAPPGAAPFAAVGQLRRGERSAVGDLAQHRVDVLCLLLAKAMQLALAVAGILAVSAACASGTGDARRAAAARPRAPRTRTARAGSCGPRRCGRGGRWRNCPAARTAAGSAPWSARSPS